MKKRAGPFLKLWLPPLLWAGIIFYFSSVPNLSSGLEYDFLLRKAAHAIEYAILSALVLRALLGEGISVKRAVLYSAAIAVAYAFTDEYHQSLVPGRCAAWEDAAIDSAGAFAGLWAWQTRRKLLQLLSRRK
jgi:VanZ family protein